MVFPCIGPFICKFQVDGAGGVVQSAHQHSTRARIPQQELMSKIRCTMHVLAKPDCSFVREIRRLCLNVSAALRMRHTNKLQLRIFG